MSRVRSTFSEYICMKERIIQPDDMTESSMTAQQSGCNRAVCSYTLSSTFMKMNLCLVSVESCQ